MTYEESQILIRIYEHYDGYWKAIMIDPEIKALKIDRDTLQKRMSYIKSVQRKETELIKKPDLSESKIVSINGRKKGKKGESTEWFVLYNDGEIGWVNETAFTDLDGQTNPLFLEFQAKHSGEEDVIHTFYSAKRPFSNLETGNEYDTMVRKKKRTICLNLLREWIEEEDRETVALKHEISQLRLQIVELKSQIKK